MQGIDVHLDTNLGKRLSALGNTLTSLTGEEEDEYLIDPMDERLDVSLEDLVDYPVKSVQFCAMFYVLALVDYLTVVLYLSTRINLVFCK